MINIIEYNYSSKIFKNENYFLTLVCIQEASVNHPRKWLVTTGRGKSKLGEWFCWSSLNLQDTRLRYLKASFHLSLFSLFL